jgi:hypothetical protein
MTAAEIHADRLFHALADLFSDVDAERFDRAMLRLPPAPTPLDPEEFARELMRRYAGMPLNGRSR